MESSQIEIKVEPEKIFLHALRAETAQAHLRLEQVHLSKRLMAEDVTDQDVVNYLSAMREVILFTQTVLYPMLAAVVVDLDDRRKLAIIDNDLASVPLYRLRIFLPSFRTEKELSVAEALGMMYVIEGSTLGGKIISNHLNDKGLLIGKSQQFFDVYGSKSGLLWKSFISMLAIYAIEHQQEKEVIKGAQGMFDAIHDYFLSVAHLQ